MGTESDSGTLPAVSFVKAPAYQDGHGGYSNPTDEQTFIAIPIFPKENTTPIEKAPCQGSILRVSSFCKVDGTSLCERRSGPPR